MEQLGAWIDVTVSHYDSKKGFRGWTDSFDSCATLFVEQYIETDVWLDAYNFFAFAMDKQEDYLFNMDYRNLWSQ